MEKNRQILVCKPVCVFAGWPNENGDSAASFFSLAEKSVRVRGIYAASAHIMEILFPIKLDRLQYFVRWLIYIVTVAVIAAFLAPLPKYIGLPVWVPLVVILPLVAARFPCLDIPRLRSVGWSPWLLLLFIIPGIGFVLQIVLFCIPAKEATAALPSAKG